MAFVVGWRERDWAKFTDDEFEAIYGGHRGVSPRAGGMSGRAGDRTGRWIWGAVAVAVLIVFFGGLALRTSESRATQQPATTPAVLFGIPGSGATAPAQAPGGTDTLCTEMALARSSGQWRCLAWTINVHHATVRKPRPYDGECAHAIVDQARGAWTCLGTNAVPDEELAPLYP